MKAFLIDGYKPRDGGRIADIPDPVPTQGQVLVRVHAAGVNLLDAKIRSGEFKRILPYRMPLVLGNDVAGDVVAVGPDVRRFKVGDEVYARPDTSGIGTFAELIAMTSPTWRSSRPLSSMAEAASVPLVGLTAWQALVERAKVQPGEKVFIQAGSGGVGTIAIQLAKHLGATVATTAGAASAAMVAGLGADIVIDYRQQDFEAVLADYDVVLHSQDDATLRKSLRVLKPGGRLISISGPPDPRFAAEIGVPWFVRPVVSRPQLDDPPSSEAPRRGLLVPVHAGRRGTTRRDHHPDRRRDDPPGPRQDVSVRFDASTRSPVSRPDAPRAKSS